MVYHANDHASGHNYAGSTHGGNVDYSMLGPDEGKQTDYEAMQRYDENSIGNDYHKLEKEEGKKKVEEKENIEKRLGEKQEKKDDNRVDDNTIKKKTAEELSHEIQQQKDHVGKKEKMSIEDAIRKAIEEEKVGVD